VFGLIQRRWPDDPHGAVGTSMGAAAICFAGSVARGFQALVIESVYAELALAFNQRIGCGYPAWFGHFRDGVVTLTEKRLGAAIDQVAPLAYIDSLAPSPILLITGSKDPHAPPHEVEMLARRIPEIGCFHVIDGAGHADVCERGGPIYQDLLLSFFDKHLCQKRIARAA
jgi:pimeloyl-ACP methyl ester carboxylesterase